MECVWSSENKLQELVLSCHVGPRDPAQAVGLGKCPYLLSHLEGSQRPLLKNGKAATAPSV